MAQKIRTRFAPSPTGFLHVGGLRTALYNYLFAKQHQGEFLLRIEDTDQERKVAGAEDSLKNVLKQFGLNWDNKTPIVQSTRLKIYQQAADQLIKEGKAYYCFCTQDRLEQIRQDQQAKKLPTKYDRHCFDLSADEVNKKITDQTPHVIRFKMPQTGTTKFTDLVRGEVQFTNDLIDDQIIIKSDGFPTYHLASVVDDHDMQISHVIRAEEWLPSTPKHILIYQALGYDIPAFAHLPLLLNPDKSKLSKRQGDVAAEDYLTKGYLPEALLNFILLLGWNPGTNQEMFDLPDMIKQFNLDKVNKAGAIFDGKKLDWLNGEYIKKLSAKDLAKLAQPFFDQAGIKTDLKQLENIVATEKDRIKRLDELVPATAFFFVTPTYNPADLIWKKSNQADTVKYLDELIAFISKVNKKDWTTAKLEEATKDFITKQGWGLGDVLWPMRFALSGQSATPSPFEIANALEQEETIKRLQQAKTLLAK